jgi:hypothetical protein
MKVLCAYILNSPFGEQSTESRIFDVALDKMNSLELLNEALVEEIRVYWHWDKKDIHRIKITNIQTEKSIISGCSYKESILEEDRITAEDWVYDDSPDIANRVIEAFKTSKKLTVLVHTKKDNGFIIIGDGKNTVLDKNQAEALLGFMNSKYFPK